MKAFRDFYGGDLLGYGDIDKAKTKKELAQIIDDHEAHMEMMLCDAISHIERFKKEVKLHLI